jgi:hypothetical protein
MTKHVRTFTAVLLIAAGALALAGSAVSATSAREINDREKRCRFGSLEGGVKYWTDRELKLTASCALRKWPADKATVWMIAERESHWGARAVNSSSGACGVFQHIGWAPRVQKFNHQVREWNAAPSCFNGRSNILVSIRMMSNSGFSPWGF